MKLFRIRVVWADIVTLACLDRLIYNQVVSIDIQVTFNDRYKNINGVSQSNKNPHSKLNYIEYLTRNFDDSQRRWEWEGKNKTKKKQKEGKR